MREKMESKLLKAAIQVLDDMNVASDYDDIYGHPIWETDESKMGLHCCAQARDELKEAVIETLLAQQTPPKNEGEADGLVKRIRLRLDKLYKRNTRGFKDDRREEVFILEACLKALSKTTEPTHDQ